MGSPTRMIEDATIRSIEQELRRLNEAAAGPDATTLRTRVMTHMAWIPPDWERAARAVLDGLGERHPSRTILLLPDSEADRDVLDAEVDLRCFAGGGPERSVCSEVIAIWLRGRRAAAPASVVQPLLVPDLPVFLRWRGRLPFGAVQLDQLVEVADRLVVDSREWDELESDYGRLADRLGDIAVSDIAWARLTGWREAIAALWPGIAEAGRLRVRGQRADAVLLAGWLGTRLGCKLDLEHEPAEDLELVQIDGQPVLPDRLERKSSSDLLSEQLELFARDPIYEETVGSFAGTAA